MSHRPRSLPSTEKAHRRSRRRALLLGAVLSGWLGVASGGTQVWAVAGEPGARADLARSSATAVWVADVLRSSTGGAAPMTLLADPSPELPDPRGAVRLADSPATLQPLARVFGQQGYNVLQPRRLKVSPTLAGARADSVSAVLDKSFAGLAPSDRGLFFYAGPELSGGHERDPGTSALRLADGTALSVAELDKLARQVPADVPMRFVLTQCHANGFQRLVRPAASEQRSLGRHNRCVFTAEPMDHLGQHCPTTDTSAEVDALPSEGEARDYATLFFSALAGRSRSGAPLRRSADLDGNRIVTPHEAHLYALIEGDSRELPRASTEAYLERWQPAWLRYLDTSSEPDNLYGRVAMALAERLRLPLKGRALVDALDTRQKELMRRLERLDDEARRVNVEIERLQTTLRRALIQRWPAAAHPHTSGYARFLAQDAGAAQNFLLAQTATYPTLVTRQERQARIQQDRLALDRDLTQLDKLLRMRQLARLQAQFDRHASESARLELGRLERCEKTPL